MDLIWASVVGAVYLACLLLLVAGGYLVYRSRIKHAPQKSILPEGIGTVEFSYRMKNGIDADATASLLYDWAGQGHISLVQHRDGGFTVYRRKPLEKTHPDYEHKIYRVLFESGNGENSVHSSRIALICKEINDLIRKAVKQTQRNSRPRWRYLIAPACWSLACLFAVGCVVWLGAERKTLLGMQFQVVEIVKDSLGGYLTAILSAWPSLLIYSISILILLFFMRRILLWMRPKWADMKKKIRWFSILLGLLSTVVLMGGMTAICYGLFVDVATDATMSGMMVILSCSGLLCVVSALVPVSGSFGLPMKEFYGFYRYLMKMDPQQMLECFEKDSEAFSRYLAYAVSVGGEQSLLQRCREVKFTLPSWISMDSGSKFSQESFLMLLEGQIDYLKACFQLKRPSEDVVNHKTPMWGASKTGK